MNDTLTMIDYYDMTGCAIYEVGEGEYVVLAPLGIELYRGKDLDFARSRAESGQNKTEESQRCDNYKMQS